MSQHSIHLMIAMTVMGLGVFESWQSTTVLDLVLRSVRSVQAVPVFGFPKRINTVEEDQVVRLEGWLLQKKMCFYPLQSKKGLHLQQMDDQEALLHPLGGLLSRWFSLHYCKLQTMTLWSRGGDTWYVYHVSGTRGGSWKTFCHRPAESFPNIQPHTLRLHNSHRLVVTPQLHNTFHRLKKPVLTFPTR